MGKHKEELEAEKEAALAKRQPSAAEAGSSAPAAAVAAPKPMLPPDYDERKTLNDIWKQGEEDSTDDWLSGKGLKFHTTSDKAFAMDAKKFKEAVTPAGAIASNREAA